MQKITLNRSKNTVSAPYLPYTAYKAFVEGATALNAQIAPHAKGVSKATFNSVEDAKKFVTEWTSNYNANRKVEPTVAPTPKSTPTKKSTTSKPTATKGKTTSSTKKATAPRKAKGEAFDFGKIKGNTKSEKNRALHAMLVGMGIGDSRTKEYQAIWNARTWAK